MPEHAADPDKRVAPVKYPPHVKNWSDKAHHLEQIPTEKRTPEEHAAYKKASKQSMYGGGQSPEYKAHLASEKKGGKRAGSAPKYDHPNVVGKAENLKGGDASKAHGMSFAGKKYSASGKTGKSMHDGTPVRHFREETKDGADTGEHLWMDDKSNVHADDVDSVKSLRERHESHTSKAGGDAGHALPAGPVKHADSAAADKWMDGTIGKLKDAGYSHKGFTLHGSTWSHPDHGDLHIMHGVSNPADLNDDAIYSTVVHGEKGTQIVRTPSGDQQDVTDDTLKKHPMWSQSDFDYFKSKGYEPRDILEIWDRDWNAGKGPVTHDKASDVVGTMRKKGA